MAERKRRSSIDALEAITEVQIPGQVIQQGNLTYVINIYENPRDFMNQEPGDSSFTFKETDDMESKLSPILTGVFDRGGYGNPKSIKKELGNIKTAQQDAQLELEAQAQAETEPKKPQEVTPLKPILDIILNSNPLYEGEGAVDRNKVENKKRLKRASDVMRIIVMTESNVPVRDENGHITVIQYKENLSKLQVSIIKAIDENKIKPGKIMNTFLTTTKKEDTWLVPFENLTYADPNKLVFPDTDEERNANCLSFILRCCGIGRLGANGGGSRKNIKGGSKQNLRAHRQLKGKIHARKGKKNSKKNRKNRKNSKKSKKN